MMQQTLDGRLISLDSIERNRTQSSASIYSFWVKFLTNEGEETFERVKMPDCDGNGLSADERVVIAARHKSPYDDLETYEVKRFEQTDGSTDEWRVKEFLEESDDDGASFTR